MADADGASKFADLAKLEKALDDLNGKKVSQVFQNCAKWTKALLGWSWNACRKPRGIARGVPGRPGVYLRGFFFLNQQYAMLIIQVVRFHKSEESALQNLF